MIKRFIAFFIALAMLLTTSNVWSMTVYAAVSTPSSPYVMRDTTVNSGDTVNYTQGIYFYSSNSITFTNNGVVNVDSIFTVYSAPAVEFQNNGTFTFTGDTFDLNDSGAFINNGTATIKDAFIFLVQVGSSFINNGTLYLEDISNVTLDGFVNNGYVVVPDDADTLRYWIETKPQIKGDGQVYTKTEFESKKVRYSIKYEGLNAGGYYDYNNPNPTDYEWAAADPQDVTLADPTLGGYEFLGWTGLDITEPTKNFTFSSNVRKEVTVTAHWKPIVYTITYDLDGGSFYSYQEPPTEYKRGQQEGIPSPYKNGYTFNGWIDTDSGEQVSTASERYYYMPPAVLGDKTYKASFIANSDTQYKVICYYQNIDGTYKEEKHLFTGETGAQVSASSEKYAKEHFYFDSGNSDNLLSGTVKGDNSLELKLYFNRNRYTVTYKSQDGSETLWRAEKYYDEKVGEYGGVIPTKESDDDLYTYVFDNWAREEPDRDFGYDVSDVPVLGDITFFAAFKLVRDESIVVVKWLTDECEGFVLPEQTEIRLAAGSDYNVSLQLLNEHYYVGTKEWHIGAKEGHIYWYDPANGEKGVEYTIDKEDFNSPVVLTIPNVRHDTFIMLKADYHGEHDYSPEDDSVIVNGNCTTDSIIRHFCYKCGHTYDEIITADGHALEDTFDADVATHWKNCRICNEKIGTAAHTPNEGVVTHEPTHHSTGTKTYTCTVCGYVTGRDVLDMIPHTPEGDWHSNAQTHYKTCSCGAILDETSHTPDNGTVTLEPTYVSEGKREYRCTVCGYLIGEETIAPLGHNVDDEWQSDVSGHWRNCECGEKHNFGEHISAGGLVTIEPTYDSWGERVFSCTICGYVLRTETILPLSHETNGEWVSDKDGHWKEGCGCGEKHEYSEHISDSGTVILYPTHTENGEIEYRCTVCGYVTGRDVLDMIPHTPEGDWQSNAQVHYKTCSCGEMLEETPHTSDSGTVTLYPTNTETGKIEYRCTVCGYVIGTETIPALGGGSHTPSNPSVPSVSFEIPKLPEPSEPTEPVIPDKPVAPSPPESGIPFIKNETGTNGWDAIKAETENAAEGSTVIVDMNGTTVVPGYVIDTVRHRDITIVLDMGDDIAWIVNGKSVTADKIGDIDFAVKKNAGTIPVDAVNKLTGKRYSIQISLAHDGEFGFTAVLSINLGSDNAGLYAALYFYNDGGTELIDESEIGQDGTAQLTFSHASDYLIVIGEKSDNDVEKPDNSGDTSEIVLPESNDKTPPPAKPDTEDTEENNPKTGEPWQPWRITLIGSMAAIIGSILSRRKKTETK